MTIKSEILSQFEAIAKESNAKLAPLTDDLPLTESGLDSVSFAIVVARLEDALGSDPFANLDADRFPVTLGDFVKIYEDAAA
jgi:acyl carrier protein